MMGGALGLAALASLAEAKGYHAAFAAGALFAALAAAGITLPAGFEVFRKHCAIRRRRERT